MVLINGVEDILLQSSSEKYARIIRMALRSPLSEAPVVIVERDNSIIFYCPVVRTPIRKKKSQYTELENLAAIRFKKMEEESIVLHLTDSK